MKKDIFDGKRLALMLLGFTILNSQFTIPCCGQTRTAVEVVNATGALAAPTNFFAANSNLLNQAVNNSHGGGGSGGYSPDGTTIILNGSGLLEVNPADTSSLASLGLAITNNFVPSAAGHSTNQTLLNPTNTGILWGLWGQALAFTSNYVALDDAYGDSLYTSGAIPGHNTITLQDNDGDQAALNYGTFYLTTGLNSDKGYFFSDGSGNVTAASFTGPGGALTGLSPSALTGSGVAPTAAILYAGASANYMVVVDAAGHLVGTNTWYGVVDGNLASSTNFNPTNLAGNNATTGQYMIWSGANWTNETVAGAGLPTFSAQFDYNSGSGTNIVSLASSILTGVLNTNLLPGFVSDWSKVATNGLAAGSVSSGTFATNLLPGFVSDWSKVATNGLAAGSVSSGTFATNLLPGMMADWSKVATNGLAAGSVSSGTFATNLLPGMMADWSKVATNGLAAGSVSSGTFATNLLPGFVSDWSKVATNGLAAGSVSSGTFATNLLPGFVSDWSKVATNGLAAGSVSSGTFATNLLPGFVSDWSKVATNGLAAGSVSSGTFATNRLPGDLADFSVIGGTNVLQSTSATLTALAGQTTTPVNGGGVTNLTGAAWSSTVGAAVNQSTNYSLTFNTNLPIILTVTTNVCFTNTVGGQGFTSYLITNSGAAGTIIYGFVPTNALAGYTNDLTISGTNWMFALTNTTPGRVVYLSAYKSTSGGKTFTDVVWNHFTTLP